MQDYSIKLSVGITHGFSALRGQKHISMLFVQTRGQAEANAATPAEITVVLRLHEERVRVE
ncbi:MAG: hypothetical protein KatS3mg130_0642 [Candidatus Sumerlaea sp.]|nr:MAG: hypothetical protein KatS3mg130_0642 [Candidatus Sumerlaea sp.]